jgi:hypothetical protein
VIGSYPCSRQRSDGWVVGSRMARFPAVSRQANRYLGPSRRHQPRQLQAALSPTRCRLDEGDRDWVTVHVLSVVGTKVDYMWTPGADRPGLT